MKKFTFLALAAVAALSTGSALAQDMKMGHQEPMKMGHSMDPMMDLTPAEKKVAMMHMKKMTKAEMAVHDKEIKALQTGKTKAQAMAMMSASEKKTYAAMAKKMTPAEKKVSMKIDATAMKQGKMMKGM